jgi:hypothetical protein
MTAGKTGLIRCKDRDTGLLMREEACKTASSWVVRPFEDGKLKASTASMNAATGHGRPSSTRCGAGAERRHHDNGHIVGLFPAFYPNGKPAASRFTKGGEQANAEF